MPTIAVEVRKARKWRSCAECMKGIQVGEKYVRLYGYAEPGDRPFAIHLHIECWARRLGR